MTMRRRCFDALVTVWDWNEGHGACVETRLIHSGSPVRLRTYLMGVTASGGDIYRLCQFVASFWGLATNVSVNALSADSVAANNAAFSEGASQIHRE